MMYSEKEIAARKQIAMAAANFFINGGYDHVVLSITKSYAEVSLYLDSADELEAAKQQSNPFMIDGASQETGEGAGLDNIFYYLTLEWL